MISEIIKVYFTTVPSALPNAGEVHVGVAGFVTDISRHAPQQITTLCGLLYTQNQLYTHTVFCGDIAQSAKKVECVETLQFVADCPRCRERVLLISSLVN